MTEQTRRLDSVEASAEDVMKMFAQPGESTGQ
jgi:hypothetical protein